MRIVKWFLAVWHISDKAVCEMSVGKSLWSDFHDYTDADVKVPMHFYRYTCERCGKEFVI